MKRSSTARRRRAGKAPLTFMVAVLMMLAPFSIDSYLPSLPHIARDLQAADWQVQQTLSLYLIAFAGTTLLYGPLSDAFGRRAVVLASLALYTVSSIGCAFAANIHWLLAMRIVQGAAASGPVVIGRAIVRDAFSGAKAQRMMSQVMLFFALAPAAAPIVGGYLQELYGWRSVFWFLTGMALLLWVWTALWLPETLAPADRHPAHPRALAKAYWRAFRHGSFMLVVLAFAAAFAGLFLYIAASPVLLYRHLGYAADDFGYMFIPLVVGLMSGAFVSGRLAGRYSHAQAVNFGFLAMLVAAALDLVTALTLTPHVWNTVGPVALYAAGMSLTLPNLGLIALECLPKRRGLASAVQGFLQMALGGVVAGVLAPVLAPRLWTLASGALALSGSGFLLWQAYLRGARPRPAVP